MITNELIERINYLARKKRYEGLTEEEAAEQKKVREIYLEGIRQQVRGQLESIKEAKKVSQDKEGPAQSGHAHSCSCGCHGHK